MRPQAILAGRLLPRLRKQGATIGLVTVDGGAEEHADRTWITRDPPSAHNLVAKVAHVLTKDAHGRFHMGHRRWRSIARAAAREFEPDVIVGFANPFMANVAAHDAARHVGAPLVTHFSDPYLFPGLRRRQTKAMARTQQRILDASVGTVFVSQALRDHVTRGTAGKHVVIPHSSPVIQAKPPGPSIRHIGALYPPREPATFFDALAGLGTEFWADGTDVELIGANTSYGGGHVARELERRPSLQPHVKAIPPVEPGSSLELMATARINVCIDPSTGPPIFLPTKFIEYVAARRPTLALTLPGSPTAELAEEVGAAWVDVRDMESIRRTLEEMRRDPTIGLPRWESAAAFEPTAIANRWMSAMTTFGVRP